MQAARVARNHSVGECFVFGTGGALKDRCCEEIEWARLSGKQALCGSFGGIQTKLRRIRSRSYVPEARTNPASCDAFIKAERDWAFLELTSNFG
jgi:hypothetical protein